MDQADSPRWHRLFHHRYGLLTLFLVLFLFISFLTRLVLLVHAWPQVDTSIGRILGIFGIGLAFDLVTGLYFSIPFIIYCMLVPNRLFRSRVHQALMLLVFGFCLFLVLFNAAAEYFFFDEFGARFNFIAVDYLIYTREVVRNIVESYPLAPLLTLLAALTVVVVLVSRRWVVLSATADSRLGTRLMVGAVLLLVCLLDYRFVTLDLTHFSSNNYANELAGNGLYDFVAAFRNNRLAFRQFYRTIDDTTATTIVRAGRREPGGTFLPEPDGFTQHIVSPAPPRPMNVVIVVMESMSARFMAHFGGRDGLTPRLDALADKGLLFTRMTATGTRTARGLEAITLSVPPTPGRSIVKRPDLPGDFSIRSVLGPMGYDCLFLYGGRGYFDNMNQFYRRNGFRVLDQTDLAPEDITFENAWGVCDEDLFRMAIRQFNEDARQNRPFCAVIMTTSNHRPYTFPAGRIDLPSHSGRAAAVKYADYAVGRFVEEAAREPWFADTLFVFVADHCASAMGKIAIPVTRYHIPMIIYAPRVLAPGRIDVRCSQVDIAPTLLALMNLSYDSRFFGRNILAMTPEEGRAFVATYARLGFVRHHRLCILDVKQRARVLALDPETDEILTPVTDDALLQEAVAWYQVADRVLLTR